MVESDRLISLFNFMSLLLHFWCYLEERCCSPQGSPKSYTAMTVLPREWTGPELRESENGVLHCSESAWMLLSLSCILVSVLEIQQDCINTDNHGLGLYHYEWTVLEQDSNDKQFLNRSSLSRVVESLKKNPFYLWYINLKDMFTCIISSPRVQKK